MSFGFGVRCSAKSRTPRCDQQQSLAPSAISVTPSDSPLIPFDLSLYVSTTGSDANNGLTTNQALETAQRAFEIVRETGYNNSATIYFENSSSVTPEDYTITDCINVMGPFNGKQCNPVTLRSSNLITVGTTTFTSAANSTPTGNPLVRFTVASTSGMQPGHILSWSTDSVLIGYVVNATTVEVCGEAASVNNDTDLTLPNNGDTLTFSRPGANLIMSGTVGINGSGNEISFREISVGLGDGSIIFRGISVSLIDTIFHNQNSGNGGTLTFSGALEFSGNAAFLGYVYGTSGGAVAGEAVSVNLENITGPATLTNSLFDHCTIAVSSVSSQMNRIIIRRLPTRITGDGANYRINGLDMLNVSMDGGGVAADRTNCFRLDTSDLTMINAYIDSTNELTNPVSQSVLAAVRSGTLRCTNVFVVAGDIPAVSCDNTGQAVLAATDASGGAIIPFPAAVTMLNTSNTNATLDMAANSLLSIATSTDSPMTFTNAGTATVLTSVTSNVSIIGQAGDVVTLATAGVTAINASGLSNVNMDRTTMNGSTAEVVLSGNSHAVASANVALTGATMVTVGTLATAAPPATGNIRTDIAGNPGTGAGDGSTYTTL